MTKKGRRKTAEGRREEFLPICLSAFWRPIGSKGQKPPLNNVSVPLVPCGKLAQQEGFKSREQNIRAFCLLPFAFTSTIHWQVGIRDREVVVT